MSADANYDPFTYGQVRLGGGAAAKSGGAAASPEDMLFESASAPAAPGGSDTTWELMQSDMSGLLPESSNLNADQFADEVLGNGSPLMSAPTPVKPSVVQPQRAAEHSRPAVAPRQPAAGAAGHAAPPATAAARPAAPRPAPTPMPRAMPMPARSGSTAVIIAGVVAAAGIGVGAWFFLIDNNPVMGGIAAVTGVVGAVFGWMALRR